MNENHLYHHNKFTVSLFRDALEWYVPVGFAFFARRMKNSQFPREIPYN